MKNIAIIPARSGSKGLKNKNIRLLNGKPLIAYTVEAACRSNVFDVIMVSTDSSEYADICQKYGAEVPFMRSKETSSDRASSWDVVKEVLSGYDKMEQTFDTFCLLQPTSPIRTDKDIQRAYELYQKKRAIAVVSVCELEHPIAWCGSIGDDLSLNGFVKKENAGQRQLQKKYYRPNGAIYAIDVKEFCKDGFIYRRGAYAYIMDRKHSLDIDAEEDFEYAEFMLLKADGKAGV